MTGIDQDAGDSHLPRMRYADLPTYHPCDDAYDQEIPCRWQRAFRNLVARIDGDGGQRQEGESAEETLARADAAVVQMIGALREAGQR